MSLVLVYPGKYTDQQCLEFSDTNIHNLLILNKIPLNTRFALNKDKNFINNIMSDNVKSRSLMQAFGCTSMGLHMCTIDFSTNFIWLINWYIQQVHPVTEQLPQKPTLVSAPWSCSRGFFALFLIMSSKFQCKIVSLLEFVFLRIRLNRILGMFWKGLAYCSKM